MGSAISQIAPTPDLKQKATQIDATLLEYKEQNDQAVNTKNNYEWDNLIGNSTPDDLASQSLNPSNCSINNDYCMKRLLYIVNNYENIQKTKGSAYNFIMSLKSYSMIQLLNDWIHIKSVYIDDKYNNNINKSSIWDYLNLNLKETEQSQDIYTRNMRDKTVLGDESGRKAMYNGYSDTYNVCAIQILDTIHCYFYHGEPLDNNDNDGIKTKMEWQKTCSVDAQLANVKDALTNINDQDDNKDPYKGYSLIKEKKDLLLFGDPFFYWDFFEGDPLYCKPKYDTFKTEILTNQIFKLSELQYNDLVYLAKIWQKSIIGQYCTAFNRGGDANDQYGIEPGLPLTLSHIMSVLLFTNYDLLSYKYVNQGCNRLTTNEAYQNSKLRNQEIGHWFRLLREVVMFYGELSNNSQSFYYVMNAHLLFNNLSPQSNSPMITSSSFSNSIVNCPNNGIILEFKQHSSLQNPYLDISYCTSFPFKEQKLYSYTTVLEIRDIYMKSNDGVLSSQKVYAQAMLLWQSMINGRYFHNLLDDKTLQYQLGLIRMMDNELSWDKQKKGPRIVMSNYNKSLGSTIYIGNEANGVPKYIQSLFSYILRNSCEMWIIRSEYSLLNDKLQNYLLTLHDNAFKPFTILWNKQLRRTLKIDLVFKFVNEYTWELDNDDMDEFKQLKLGEAMEGPEMSLQLSASDYDAYVFQPLLSREYNSNTLRGGFGLTLKKIPNKFKRIIIEWDCHCPDVNYVMSSPSKVMYSGDHDGYTTFDSNLVINKNTFTFKICIKIQEAT